MNNEPNKPVELTKVELESVVGGAWHQKEIAETVIAEIAKKDLLKIETNDWFTAELAR